MPGFTARRDIYRGDPDKIIRPGDKANYDGKAKNNGKN